MLRKRCVFVLVVLLAGALSCQKTPQQGQEIEETDNLQKADGTGDNLPSIFQGGVTRSYTS